MDPAQFSQKTVNLEDGFDALLPATHPHVGKTGTGAASGYYLPVVVSLLTSDRPE